MATTLTNYDGSITTTPQQLVYPETVADIQAVLKDRVRYPSPVRAMGSHHSLTPCAASDGTIVNMSRMTRIMKSTRRGTRSRPKPACSTSTPPPLCATSNARWDTSLRSPKPAPRPPAAAGRRRPSTPGPRRG